MEKGSMRVDANVSVRRPGEPYRTRTELKNMNSFNYVARGIEAEVARQIRVYEDGGEVAQETYDFDAATGKLTPHRSKEEAEDYRYFPEPDLVPVEPPAELVERLRGELPEAPGARIRRLEGDVGYELAHGLVTTGRAGLYERTVAAGADARATANVVMNQLAGAGVDPEAVNPGELAKLVEARERIPRPALAEALAASADPGFSADRYLGDGQISDESQLEPLVERILAENPGQVEAYRGGKHGLLGFFVGQVMRETQGKANPRLVNELLRSKLGA
jgi:aspartyl-tRNA(Asn)/glutamyl-tRNA(Gln) amidotransferase subunit B